MAQQPSLRGMTWSHPRGLDPLVACVPPLRDRGVAVTWDARSLQGFEEASIQHLATQYDLIAIDHPFLGDAFRQGALHPVDGIVGEAFVDELRASSVGPSFQSYLWKDRLWAIPVDAAAQVAAFRADLLADLGRAVPRSWAEVRALVDALPAGRSVAMPANPTHVLLAFGTICHAVAADRSTQADLRPRWWRDDGFDPETARAALALLRSLLDALHPMSWDSDPIQIFDHMVGNDDVVYTPIAFGYSNYARPSSYERPLGFCGVPSMDGAVIGGMLGGVGLCVSRQCRDLEAAAAVLRFVAASGTQRGLYTEAGGQPAHREAWIDERVNTICPNFFAPTLASLDASFVRPRLPGYPAFQREGGEVLHRLLRQGASDDEMIAAMNALWSEIRERDV
ncbi:extracellular solute-binding protein [Methylobacterium nodulans]|uniref:Extracellular solute-binding protein family 1 n=1 Tax=Methylobacterium nodulans (strain LMG 21967 / CNCM I-2342 / ORS 2060) TaxID=460265 RepID=B8IXF6_METNO|nr:extracellular solute-binding protein [Methylobacterium nodulans]ACL63197.1 extracellular solute-binding protein family 1 [Methylobacterium nodulans ORS 2060]